MKKRCSKCNVEYDVSFFNKKSSSKDGLQAHCKACLKKFHKAHYIQNEVYYKEKALKHNTKYRTRNLEYIVNYFLTHPCIDCGRQDPQVLEFDHRGDKSYDVSTLTTYSLETLISEIAKCDVRCANCHRRRTAEQFGHFKKIRIPIMDLLNQLQNLKEELNKIEQKEEGARCYFNNYHSTYFKTCVDEFLKCGLNMFFDSEDLKEQKSDFFTVTLASKLVWKNEKPDTVAFVYKWVEDRFINLETGTEIFWPYQNHSEITPNAAVISGLIKQAVITDFILVLQQEVEKRKKSLSYKVRFASVLGKNYHH